MKEDYSILMMGKLYNPHMERFVRNLKFVNSHVTIDCFGQLIEGKEMPSDYRNCFRQCELVSFSHCFDSIPVLRSIEIINNWRKHFHAFSKGKHYDIVNIHFPVYVLRYIIKDVRRIADNIVLTPWGSDVYRINKLNIKNLKIVYGKADYVAVSGRFADDCSKIFHIPQEKIVGLKIGSESIDTIISLREAISSVEAKKQLGISNSYVISCGYNSSPAQRHKCIIESIGRIKGQLPDSLVLLFPVTYPKNPVYIEELKQQVKSLKIKAIFFEDFLDNEALFLLRQATDMFIHVQTTDASNASIKEYILLKKNCINGSWLRYPEIEGCKLPYYLVDNLDDLGDVVLDAYKKGPVKIEESVMKYIEHLGSKSTAEETNNFFMSICH